MKIEITVPLELTDQQQASLAMHSFYNVLNVIVLELQFLEKILNRPDALITSRQLCRDIKESFYDRDRALATVRDLERQKSIILDDVTTALAGANLSPERQAMLDESMENIHGILDVVDVRVRELLARQEVAGAWTDVAVEEIVRELERVFDTIARRSRGNYGIVYDESAQGAQDYLMRFDIRGNAEGVIRIPLVLTDVLRDLTANARKYTEPGGRIDARLEDAGKTIRLVVTDTGRGIPPEEVEDVVRYGVRATNAKPSETRGGGFGLTKAYYLVRQHGGRMWIDSELGFGTTVTLEVPKPAV